MTNLSERMMLVSLHISVYAGAKVDSKVSHEVVSMAGAARKSGKFTKNLFADALEPIHKAAKAARNEHDQMTLPWRHAQDCLPAGVFLKYMEAQRLNKAIFDREVGLFLDCYDDHIAHAEQRLGKLFSASDYPDKDTLRARFEFDIEVSPLPTTGDFRVELVDDDRAEIVADLEKRIQDRVDQGRKALAERIRSCLERMKDRLSAYEVDDATGKVSGRFTDTLVTNLVDLADLIPGMNLTDDQGIAQLHQGIVSKLIRHDAQALRVNPVLRSQVAQDAAALLDNMQGVWA